MSEAKAKWDARSRGGWLGHWIYLQIIRLLGPSFAALLLYPVVTFYLLVAGQARAASMLYTDRVLGPAPNVFVRWGRAWKHLHAFATAYLDGAMLGSLGPGIFQIEHLGTAIIKEVNEAQKGAVLLTAHMGTWELSTGMLKEKHSVPRVAIVMFKSDAEELQSYIEKIHGKRPRLIAVGGGELQSLEILRAVRDGEFVAMQGDRTVDTNDLRIPFFGHDARWPIGPWVIAAISGAPLLMSFAMRTGPRRYKFLVDPPRRLRFERGKKREDQLREWMTSYVQRLEALLREYPYQWFNFFDFWAAEPKLPEGGGVVAPVKAQGSESAQQS